MDMPSLDVLTPREREVLTLIAEGMSLLAIAQRLHRSLKTIESHRLSLGKKLDASNRVELARIAIAHGLVTLPETPEASRNGDPPHRRMVGGDEAAGRWAEAILDRVYGRSGADYLNELSCAICDVVGVSHAGVCVPDLDEGNDGLFRSLACSSHGQVDDQFAYHIKHTPREVAIDKGVCVIEQGARQRFPEDKLLADFEAQAYAGVCLTSRGGEVVGVLWALDQKSLEHPGSVSHLLQHLAPQVAAVVSDIRHAREALRLCEQRGKALAKANRELRLHNEQLDQIAAYFSGLTERMSDGLVVLDESWRIKYANDKFAEIVKEPRTSVVGKLAIDFLTESSREKFKSMQEARQNDELEHYRLELLRDDGSTREILVSPRTLYDEHGKFAGSFAVVTDTADLQKA